jgi:hypothetical protein
LHNSAVNWLSDLRDAHFAIEHDLNGCLLEVSTR